MMPQEVRSLLARLESAGYQGWAVGGCVRDTLRGAVPSDWDVTTDARPEQVMALFGERAIPTGLKHGTVTVCAGETHVEVTTFRRDGTYSDHRRPDAVQFSSSLEEDLARRDLTVNAMAMDLRGHICDPFGGQEDLSRRVLRCVGAPCGGWTRTRCGSCGRCGSRQCWVLPLSRTRRRRCTAVPRCWRTSPRNASWWR